MTIAVPFSSRLEIGEENELAACLSERRAAGLPIIDLTLSNPTAAGFCADASVLLSLGDPRGTQYQPELRGLVSAREAVAAAMGDAVAPDRLVLTASTSEAYSLLFKLLGDPGDEVLMPQPSYPLLDHLTRLEGLVPIPYHLHYTGEWQFDHDEIRGRIGSRTRALIVVNPNNPTGNYVRREEMQALVQLCADHGVALISDEVFFSYPFNGDEKLNRVSATEVDCGLCFSLGGLSKSIAMPQAKLSWIAVCGKQQACDAAMRRLDVIADTYLSVNTAVQLALPHLFEAGAVTRKAISERVRNNRHKLAAEIKRAYPECTLLTADGGWYAVVQTPAVFSEQRTALKALTDCGVWVHPGYFYDFVRESFFVLSLLLEAEVFEQGVRGLLDSACAR